MEDFSEILNANKTAGRKRLESITLEVLNIKEEAPETYKIKLILPLSINGELSSIVNLAFKEQRLETLEPGVVFPPGTEVAFQPHVNQGKLNHLLKLLKTNSKGELKWLQPVKGYPGPELCYPSLDLLKLLLKKTLNTQDKRIKNKAALLQAVNYLGFLPRF